MRVLVTGAAGFIASHFVERLLARGDAVVGLDNFDAFYARAEKERNLATARASARFTFVEGDIRDRTALDRALPGADAVVHFAAKAGVRPSLGDPGGYADVNVRGTAEVFAAAERAKVRRLVFASSSSVYGGNKSVPFREDDRVDAPISPYAATKRAAELLAHAHAHLTGASVTCLRFFTVYGPRQRPDLAIRKFAEKMLRGEELELFGQGSARDYTYVDDIVDGTLRALGMHGGFRLYNLGNSHPIELDALVPALERALGVTAKTRRAPMQPGDVDLTYASIDKARAELGYDPKTTLEAGLAAMAAWLKPAAR